MRGLQPLVREDGPGTFDNENTADRQACTATGGRRQTTSQLNRDPGRRRACMRVADGCVRGAEWAPM
jgi:hypothetical protein